ncbi:PODN [Branchiostoma lanceolatum]|uniref:PODN protein n=1 Tax=Branchiostoma lanceolatum TaxID=7740 RepID=A0A8K0ELJ0_BRALA|nr:PODN [Branchiostoma lanceolatum]
MTDQPIFAAMLPRWLRRCCAGLGAGGWLLLAVLADSIAGCPEVCQCSDRTVHCVGRQLTQVPTSIPADTTRLYLQNNKIKELRSRSLRHAQGIFLLNLMNNQLRNGGIESEALEQMSNLRGLYLSGNNLNYFPRWNLPYLEYLDLSNNDMRDIPPRSLDRFHYLKELFLRNIGITRLSRDSLYGLKSLEGIRLEYNKLRSIPSDALQRVASTLKRLCLRGNPIGSLDRDSFRNLIRVEYLDIGNTDITHLGKDVFSPVPRLKTLLLSGNSRLKFLAPDAFSLAPLLNYLALDACGFETLSPSVLTSIPKLDYISLQYNPWTCDEQICRLRSWMIITKARLRHRNKVYCTAPVEFRGAKITSNSFNELCGMAQPKTTTENGWRPMPTTVAPKEWAPRQDVRPTSPATTTTLPTTTVVPTTTTVPTTTLQTTIPATTTAPTTTAPTTTAVTTTRATTTVRAAGAEATTPKIVSARPPLSLGEDVENPIVNSKEVGGGFDIPNNLSPLNIPSQAIDPLLGNVGNEIPGNDAIVNFLLTNQRCPDICRCEFAYVDCSNVGLAVVPNHIPPQTFRLYLDHNGLVKIPSQKFAGMWGLLTLELQYNQLTSEGIVDGSFEGLLNLKYLILSKNHLTRVPEELPPNLQYLALDGNLIRSLPMEAVSPVFTKAPQLSWVALHNNPWTCNLHVCGLRGFMYSNSIYVPNRDRLTCSAPDHLNRKRIESILNICAPHLHNIQHYNKVPTTQSPGASADDLAEEERDTRGEVPTYRPLDLRENGTDLAADCPEKCQCNPFGHVDCRNLGLTAIPDDVPHYATNFYLEDNTITRIPENSVLKHLNKLKVLHLHNNFLTGDRIDKSAFRSLTSLEYLHLNGNYLTRVNLRLPELLKYLYLSNNFLSFVKANAFKEAPELERLYLEENLLSDDSISEEAFNGLHKLRHLIMSGNKLRGVPRILPGSLEVLQLDGNQISSVHVDSLSNMNNLVKLSLANNEISDEGLSEFLFKDLHSLQRLHLSNNSLEKVPDQLPRRIKFLYLDGNHIRKLEADQFTRIRHLIWLHLQDNKLRATNIDPSAFRGLRRITLLNLSKNQLYMVPRGLPASLKNIYFSNNKIVNLPPHTFSELKGLMGLYLDHNDLDNTGMVDGSLYGLSKLLTLDLSFNYMTHFPAGLPRSTNYLYFQKNYIKEISKRAITAVPNLRWLYLQNNRLTDGSLEGGIFTYLPDLMKLDLSGNYLGQVPTDLPRKLEYLYLNDNDIKMISEDAFKKTPFIRELELSDNPLSKFDIATGALTPLKFLRRLYIADDDENSENEIDYYDY